MTTAIRTAENIRTDLEAANKLLEKWDADFRSLEPKLKKLSKADLIKRAAKVDHPHMEATFQQMTETFERADWIKFILRWSYGEAITDVQNQIAELKNELAAQLQWQSEVSEKAAQDIIEAAGPLETILSPAERNRRASTPTHMLDPKRRLTKRNVELIRKAAMQWFGTEDLVVNQASDQVEVLVGNAGPVYAVWSDYRFYYFLAERA
jgi:hypothetical protein